MDSLTGSVMGSFDEPLALDEHTYAGRREVLFFFVLGALCIPPLFFLPLDPGDHTAVATIIPFRLLSYTRHVVRTSMSTCLSFFKFYTDVFTTVGLVRRLKTVSTWLLNRYFLQSSS